MSTEQIRAGLVHWLPALVDALDADPFGAGTQLRAVIAGRSARIALDDDVVIVESLAKGQLTVRTDDSTAHHDGYGATTSEIVLALIDGMVEIDQVVESGHLEIHSTIDDALWMHRVVELLLDGSSRVAGLRDLADAFRRQAPAGSGAPLISWREGAHQAEFELLGRLGLLEGERVDHDG